MADPYDCERCDQQHPRGCRGHVDECADCEWRGANHVDKPCHKCGGPVILRPCRRHPRKGGDKCPSHGGNSPRAIAANTRRLAHDEAVASLADVEIIPIGDPLDALAQVAAEAVALKDHFANLVAELNRSMSFTTRLGDQKLDARVALYERALDRSQKFLSDWVRLGFEDRRVQLDEIRTARVVAFVRGVLADHGIDPTADQTRQIMRSWQPVLDGEPPPQ